ncbi:DUF4350 domain-containing protein [Bacteroides pyogenes]|uniref:DUF4350 domain-containing protein n=1 Tax=Bacteroides pyogenes TaxID=310300 RepID=A0A5D3FEU3_9BACE|nr:DUF4350 domain-containing protein [Bacteroides pyogenes]TYK32781.1 DUF4350 domain-containing protein [Bacteroides pyogenes]TYK37543.1 DUF4350 domain-containing protein [Bacteroides pyogenes]TYK46522.1 DUF4350 domain-containing protein [Bacteroides pyogenes]
MNGNRWFVGFVLVFIVLVFAFQYRLPKKFVWSPTFSRYDEQPFGCALFDSLLRKSLPRGYDVSRKTFPQLAREDSTQRRGVLLVANNLSLTDTDVKALLEMAERGDKIMLASTSFGRALEDTLRFACGYSRFIPAVLKKMATSSAFAKDTVCWLGDPARYSPQAYLFYPPFCQSFFLRYDSASVQDPLAVKQEGKPVRGGAYDKHATGVPVAADSVTADSITAENVTADRVTADSIIAESVTANHSVRHEGKLHSSDITADSVIANRITAKKAAADRVTADGITANSTAATDTAARAAIPEKEEVPMPVAFAQPWGKGEIILVSTPLVFTNYGVLDGENVNYIFRLLSQMGDVPVIRLESYLKETAQEQQSPFRYFLSRQPLRWALYLTVAGIVLFMLFTARRRQRAIPVIEEPANRSLEFTQLIGTLYYQRKSHADLVQKKFVYFAEVLRREIQADVEDVAEDERTFGRIALKTGMDAAEIAAFIRELRPVIYGGRDITVEDMKKYIDKMNEIIEHI